MHDLPRQLTVDELAELFEGRTRLVEKLALRDDPLASAQAVIAELSQVVYASHLNQWSVSGRTRGATRYFLML